ncbi:hypothetical protein AK33_05810 [Mannheimia granulomatis]|uniref:DUF4376 domain-containing protein n=1 Tax=Mannheimia granulomatis TaxID=85402 RepID=A0A011LYD4_9PAST|nr:hypothetical protein AK33_05810 [Mannheimia granulomatis]
MFDAKGNFLASSNCEPNLDDLESRGETAIESNQAYIEPFYDGRKIVDKGIAPSKYHTWDGKKWVISNEQQAVKKADDIAKVRDAINALRDSKINGGVYVDAVGKWIDTDATAERNILSVKASYDLFGDMEIAWTCADNSILMLTKDKLLLIWQALMAAKTSNHANALRHKAAVEQSNDPLAYDYSDGWSKTYQEFLEGQING